MSVLSRASRTRFKSSGSSVDTLPIEIDRSVPQSFSPAESVNEITTFTPVSLSIKELGNLDTPSPSTSQIAEPSTINTRLTSNTENTARAQILIDQSVAGADVDDRSSSLSEIDGRPGHGGSEDSNNRSRQDSAGEDTDAETERLEDSPHKPRKHQNVVLSFSKKNSLRASEPSHARNEMEIPPNPRVSTGSNPESKATNEIRFDQTSEISSLGDITENSRPASPAVRAGKKRKRSVQDEIGCDQDDTTKSLRRAAANLADHVNRNAEHTETLKLASTDMGSHLNNGYDKFSLGNIDGDESTQVAGNTLVNDDEAVDTALSNGEDAELEGDAIEADLVARNEEELSKKKSALDALGAIEKCFATLRDKLFDDRLAQYNEELNQLTQTSPVHSEYLTMMECIDQRRDEKTEYEQTLLKYKIQALERKSVAERAQIHSQYMQTARDIRDRVLEQISKEWYQIQRERRSWDGDLPCYMYKYPAKRSQQITQQAAYNSEVSVLSGIAKYVGFPAAPKINGARSNEIDDDLKSMGIAPYPHSVQQFQPPPIRVNSSMSNFSRQRPDAEVDFLQHTPWANPQHPVHHQVTNVAHRQLPHNSRPHSPFVTPTAHRRTIENYRPNGSASTVLDQVSVQGSSIVPTPSTMDPSQSTSFPSGFAPYTPSKSRGATQEETFAQVSPKSGTPEKGLVEASIIAHSPIILDAVGPTRAVGQIPESPEKSHKKIPPHHSPRVAPSSPFKVSSPQLRVGADQTHHQSSLLPTRSPHPVRAGSGIDVGE